MATVGRWGIARDLKGELAGIHEWPWYWRYPIAILGFVAIIAVSLYLDGKQQSGKPQWALLVVAGLAALYLLSVTYELGALLIVVVIGWGASKAIDAITPESWEKASRTELAEVRDVAQQALYTAEQASAAVDDGSASGTTMGAEIEEAKAEAAAASAEAAAAQAEIAELQAKIDAICGRAPALCY